MKPSLTLPLILLAAACGRAEEPPISLDTGLVYSLQVEKELDPSATKVMLFERMKPVRAGDAFLDTVVARSARNASGETLVHAYFATSADATEASQSAELWFSVDGDGKVTRRERPEAAGAFAFDPRKPETQLSTVAVDGSDTGWLLQCPSGGAPALAFGLESGALEAHATPTALCGDRLGRSARAGHFVASRPDSGNVRIDSWNVAAGVATDGVALPPPSGAGTFIVHAEEPSAGQFVVVTQTDTTLWRFGTDGLVASVDAGTPLSITQSRRVSDGALWLAMAGGRVLRWYAETSGELTELGPPALAGDLAQAGYRVGITFGGVFSVATRPNPEDAAYRIPIECAAASFRNGVHDLVPSACTPCRSRSACRLYGESYLAGVLDPARLGLYAYYSWAGYLAFYTAELARPEEP